MKLKVKKGADKKRLPIKLAVAKKTDDKASANAVDAGAIDFPGLSVKQRAEANKNLKTFGDLPDFLKKPVKKGGSMTKVQFKVMGGRAVKKSFYRTFESVDEVAKYFKEFANTRKYNLGGNDRVCTFPGSTDSIYSNMPISDILKRKPVPKEGLPDIVIPGHANASDIRMPTGFIDSSGKPVPGTHPEAKAKPAAVSSGIKSKARENGALIPLKVICGELNVEPRAARIALRKAVKDAKKYPALHASHAANARWEWPAGSTAIEDVKKAIAA